MVPARCIGEGFAVDGSLIKADANRQNGIPGPEWTAFKRSSSRAVGEYLTVLDDAAFGAAMEVTPKFISSSDPAARWTRADGRRTFFVYETNCRIDLDHANGSISIPPALQPTERLWFGRDAGLVGL